MYEKNDEAFKTNLMYVIKESQLKLGYSPTAMTLNYTLASLNRSYGMQCSHEEMTAFLQDFCANAKPELGDIRLSADNGRYSLTIPPQGTAFVHEHTDDDGFLTDLIELFSTPAKRISLDEVLRVFQSRSDKVCCMEVNNDEFQYVIWFEDGQPDNFRYCICLSDMQSMYHRLTPADYQALVSD